MDDQDRNLNLGHVQIDAQKDEDVEFWTEKFDITKAKLKAAINAAGPLAADVEAYLKNKY